MHRPLRPGRRALLTVLSGSALAVASAAALTAPVLAHQESDWNGYHLEVGFINEPVYVGDRSGLEFSVSKGNQPVAGLDQTLKAEVIYQGYRRTLEIAPESADTGNFYRASFIPTAAGPYTFHVFGTIEGQPFDQSYTSSPSGFDEVQEATAGEFPVQFPTTAELAANASQGAAAAGQLPVALGLGAAGLVVGLLALGIAISGRRRA